MTAWHRRTVERRPPVIDIVAFKMKLKWCRDMYLGQRFLFSISVRLITPEPFDTHKDQVWWHKQLIHTENTVISSSRPVCDSPGRTRLDIGSNTITPNALKCTKITAQLSLRQYRYTNPLPMAESVTPLSILHSTRDPMQHHEDR